MSPGREFTKGIFKLNPIFVLLLGLCPTLAVSVRVVDALGMGCATTFVLLCSNMAVALLSGILRKHATEDFYRKLQKIRIPMYIVIIASFVTVVELFMKGFTPALHKSLGIFVPLIVVNCIILGRAEAFASKNRLSASFLDALGMGIGFTLGLCLLATFREVLGAGKFFGYPVFGKGFQPVLIMALPPGAFLTIGLLMGWFHLMKMRKRGKGQ
jgi:electron transport complex protein RnfE